MTDLPKLKADQSDWFKRPRMSRLAAVMYPNLVYDTICGGIEAC